MVRQILQPDELLQAALGYAARGWHVFPADPQTKRPLVECGLLAATTSTNVIRDWWGKEWPHAMIALRTGAVSDVWVIDLDVDDGKNGVEKFSELSAGRLIPETIKTRTPRGGIH